jgi:hypothetical protein
MGERRGKEVGILFTLVAFVVLVNTSFMFMYIFSGNQGIEKSDVAVLSFDDSSFSNRVGSGIDLDISGSEGDGEIYAGTIYENSRGSGSNDDGGSGDDSGDDSDDGSDDSSNDDSSDDSQNEESNEDDDGNDSYNTNNNVDDNLEDGVPENEDGPPAESVEGKDLEFDFGFGGFG